MEYDFTIGTNAANDVAIGTIGSIMNLNKVPYKFGWDILGCGSAARARNIMAYKFLKANQAPYLIYIDRDVLFTPQDIAKLLKDLDDGYELIAGCYAIKGALTLANSGNGKESLVLDGTIQEVKYLATGFLGLPRSLLEKMIEGLNLPLIHKNSDMEAYPFFEEHWFSDPDAGDIWLSEDYNFCHKARQVGTKAYLDTGIKLGHLGSALWHVDGTAEVQKRNMLSEKATKAITRILTRERLKTIADKRSV